MREQPRTRLRDSLSFSGIFAFDAGAEPCTVVRCGTKGVVRGGLRRRLLGGGGFTGGDRAQFGR